MAHGDRPIAPPTAGALFLAFAGVALSGFGGVLPFARRMLVERRGWLTAEAFADTFALCQSLPGPNIVNLSFVLGGRFAGWRGALAALSGLVLPPFFIVIGLATLYDRIGSSLEARRATAALGAAGAGLVTATAARVAWPLVRGRPLLAGTLIALAFIGAGVIRLPLAWVVAGLAPTAALVAWALGRRPQGTSP